MFSFLKKKKFLEKELYPKFITRLFAATIDLALASIILIPLCNLVSSIVYDDMPPSKELSHIMSKAFKDSSDVGEAAQAFKSDPHYQEFMAEKGYSAIAIEQSIQLLLLAIIIMAFWLRTSSTPGKMLLALKIVDSRSRAKPSTIQLLIRLFSYVFSMAPLGLGIFYILINKQRRAWHDLISDTIVISAKATKEDEGNI